MSLSHKSGTSGSLQAITNNFEFEPSIEVKHFLTEGHVFVAKTPTEIITILGSCVAVCLWDKNKKIGGMNHFLLSSIDNDTQSLHQGVFATKSLIKLMLSRKCNIEDIEAKVFGGSSYMQQFEVGKSNVAMAFRVLEEAGIPVVAFHTGGSHGRKIIFRSDTGKVLMRLLTKSLKELNDEIARSLGLSS